MSELSEVTAIDPARNRGWQIWIDRGGTFTDCIGCDPRTGQLSVTKILSSDEAPRIT